MTIDNFTSITETSLNPITEFSKLFLSTHSNEREIINNHRNEIAIFHGKGFNVKWFEGHSCDCEYCDYEGETKTKFFVKKEESAKYAKDLETDWSNDDIEIIENIFYVRAVKQNNHIEGGLF